MQTPPTHVWELVQAAQPEEDPLELPLVVLALPEVDAAAAEVELPDDDP